MSRTGINPHHTLHTEGSDRDCNKDKTPTVIKVESKVTTITEPQ